MFARRLIALVALVGALVVGGCGRPAAIGPAQQTSSSEPAIAVKADPPAKPAATPETEPETPAGDGKEFAPKNKMFTILMPGDKSTQATKILPIGKHKVPVEASRSVLKDGTVFTAESVGIPAVVIRETPAEQRPDVVRDAVMKSLKGKVVDEKDIKQDKAPGKEYQIEKEKGVARMQLFIVGGFVMYAIVEGNKKEDLNSREAQAFYASFRLSDKAKSFFK